MDDREGEHGELPIDIADRAPTPEEVFLKIELLKILLKTLQQLDPNLRTAIVLRDLKGLSLRETAEFLELSRAAVKARHWRGRLELRDRFERAIR